MLETTVPSFPSYNCSEHFRKFIFLVMTAYGNFTFSWILTVKKSFLCALIQLTNQIAN